MRVGLPWLDGQRVLVLIVVMGPVCLADKFENRDRRESDRHSGSGFIEALGQRSDQYLRSYKSGLTDEGRYYG